MFFKLHWPFQIHCDIVNLYFMQNVLGQKEVLEENLECFYEKKSRKLHCLGELECGEVVWLSLEKVAAAATTSINIRGASKHFHKSFSNGEPSSQHHHQHPKHTLANTSPDPDQVETKEEEVRQIQVVGWYKWNLFLMSKSSCQGQNIC